nr:7-cyano-7-deazaguanine synthase QueC [Rhodothalassium salexigens]
MASNRPRTDILRGGFVASSKSDADAGVETAGAEDTDARMPDETPRRPGDRAVVLLSGGLDSATVAAAAKAAGYRVIALSFRYGQRHAVELDAAARVAAHVGVDEHQVLDMDLRAFGGSALTADIDVPKDRDADAIAADDQVPITYVPARNTIFLSYAMGLAEVRGADDLFIGVNAVDYSGYPDCRPGFIGAFEAMANLATRAGVAGDRPLRLHTPLIGLSKAAIVAWGTELGVDYAQTISCYDPDAQGRACGACDSCHLRRQGFVDAGLADPTVYQTD